MLADVWNSSELPIALSIFNTIPFCGPAAGYANCDNIFGYEANSHHRQLVSSFVVPRMSWQWTQWLTLMLSTFTYLTILPMHETYRPIIIKQRQKLSKTGTMNEKRSLWQHLKEILATIPFIRPLHMLFVEPVVGLLALCRASPFSQNLKLISANRYCFQFFNNILLFSFSPVHI